jgi:hypothetical protein
MHPDWRDTQQILPDRRKLNFDVADRGSQY